MRLYLLRHGETAWNHDGNRYAGRTDVPLSDVGRVQARGVAAALAAIPLTAVYASTLRRSHETAEIVAAGRGLPVVVDSRLVEVDFGDWEGKRRAEIERDDPAGWAAWVTAPETTRAGGCGETARETLDRVEAFVAELRRESGAVLVIGHNTLNRIFIAGMLGMPLRNYRRLTQDNTGISVFDLDGGAWICKSLNVTSHL